ncbi:MAG: tetratricopeptide repeat protein, partial [Planctomycetota bacterium]
LVIFFVLVFIHHQVLAELFRSIALLTNEGKEVACVFGERTRIYPVRAVKILSILLVVLPVVLPALFTYFIIKSKKLSGGIALSQSLRHCIVIGSVVLIFLFSLFQYIRFVNQREYTILTTNSSVQQLFPEYALFSGHAAQAVTIESRIRRSRAVHNFFLAPSYPAKDKEMDSYPSHFVGTDGYFAFFRKKYPEIFDRLEFACKYYVRGGAITLYRISDCAWYKPSEFEEAVKLSINGEYSSALDKFNALLKQYPENSKLLVYTGVCYVRSGKYEEAVPLLESALQHNRCEVDALLNLGYIHAISGKYDRALEYLSCADYVYGLQNRHIGILKENAQQICRDKNTEIISQFTELYRLFLRIGVDKKFRVPLSAP